MIEEVKKYTIPMILGEISEEEFLKRTGKDILNISDEITKMLKYSYNDRDNELLENTVILMNHFEENICRSDYTDVLNKLIYCDWHTQHEDIALILEFIHSPTSVEPLYTCALSHFDYLSWDTNYALAVKCIHGLAEIGNDSAIEKLKILSKHDNKVISENALMQLKKLSKKKFQKVICRFGKQ